MIRVTNTSVVLPTTGELIPATIYKDKTPIGVFARVVILLSAIGEDVLERIMKALVGTDESGIIYFLAQAKKELMLDPSSGWFGLDEKERERKVQNLAHTLYEQASNRGFRPVTILKTEDGEHITYSRKMSVSDTYLRPLGANNGALIFTVSDETGKAIDLSAAVQQASVQVVEDENAVSSLA